MGYGIPLTHADTFGMTVSCWGQDYHNLAVNLKPLTQYAQYDLEVQFPST